MRNWNSPDIIYLFIYFIFIGYLDWPEALRFRLNCPSARCMNVRACVRARTEAFSDQFAADF